MSEQQQDNGRLQLLESEELWLSLHGRYGLLEEVPSQGDCVVLTNQRLMGFRREEGRHRRVLLPIQNVEAVEVTDLARSLKPLAQGGLLLLGAVVVVLLAAAFDLGSVLPWLIVGILVLLAAITASTYFAAEDTAMITFRARTTAVALPLRTSQALRDAYSLANGFFQAKSGGGLMAIQKRGHPQVPPVEASTPRQEASDSEQKAGAPAPGAAAHPRESTQAEFPEQPTGAPMPGMIPHHQESAQGKRREDV